MNDKKPPSPLKEQRKEHKIASDDAGMRLDRWLKRRFPALSHGQVEKYLRTGQIRVDGKRAASSDRLEAGQLIRIPPPLYDFDSEGRIKTNSASSQKQAKINQSKNEKLKKLVIYQDDDVVVLNKPAGLAVQGGTGLKENLDDALMALSKDGKTKPKLVHRLDRDTSGVLLIARTDYAARQLTAAFRDRATQKIYWAITQGIPEIRQGRIDAPLVKSGEIMRVYEGDIRKAKENNERDVKSAITLYQVLDSVPTKVAFIALWPLTGRTHQLRVHLASIGTPILGDRLYNKMETNGLPLSELGQGLHLHARRLILPHPRRGMIDVTAPLGKEMQKTARWFNLDMQTEADFEDA